VHKFPEELHEKAIAERSYNSEYMYECHDREWKSFSFWRYQRYHQRIVQSSYLHFDTPKIFLEVYLFVEFVSELQFTTWRMKVEGIVSELLFPLYLTYTRFSSAIYSFLHLILPYSLVLRHSQRLTTLYHIQTADSKLLSIPQIRQYINPLPNSRFRN
jgi:hypothetical protein